MYLNEPIDFLILVFVGLMAGAINTLGGGGSLLTLPALIFFGLPPSIANASNRIGILFSSISATTGYASKGVINFPFNIYLGFSALFGSLLGAKIAILRGSFAIVGNHYIDLGGKILPPNFVS